MGSETSNYYFAVTNSETNDLAMYYTVAASKATHTSVATFEANYFSVTTEDTYHKKS